MRNTKPKTHIATSEWPLKNIGGWADAICGQMVAHAQHVFMWDDMNLYTPDGLRTAIESVRGICKKCVIAAPGELSLKRYVYGIRQGEK